VKHITAIIGILVYLALQASVAHRIAIGSVEPDFIVVCVVLFGLQRGRSAGSLFGFFVGLLVDLGNPGIPGVSNALAKTVLGYGAGRLVPPRSPGVVVLFIVSSWRRFARHHLLAGLHVAAHR
jgi:rod shape-determining protein MreD